MTYLPHLYVLSQIARPLHFYKKQETDVFIKHDLYSIFTRLLQVFLFKKQTKK